MIHVATVHYQSDEWIDIQREYLEEHAGDEFRVYAFLNGIDERYHSKFFYTSSEPVTASSLGEEHATKLNRLADIIRFSDSSPDDLLLFLDGDAFPISDVSSYADSRLKEHPLAAVQRLENAGDIQPHPCFCITTVGFWEEIGGDWRPGYQWENDEGYVSDVGGNLLLILEQNDVDWYPMHRSNQENLHPLWFGIYDDIVYHHGAGFRTPFSRVDKESDYRIQALRVADRFLSAVPGLEKSYVGKFIQNKTSDEIHRLWKQIGSENEDLSEQVFRKLRRDGDAFLDRLAHPE
jgi:hypothetical protein